MELSATACDMSVSKILNLLCDTSHQHPSIGKSCASVSACQAFFVIFVFVIVVVMVVSCHIVAHIIYRVISYRIASYHMSTSSLVFSLRIFFLLNS